MARNKRLRMFVKKDKSGWIVPMTNQYRLRPPKDKGWAEIFPDTCCPTTTTTTTTSTSTTSTTT